MHMSKKTKIIIITLITLITLIITIAITLIIVIPMFTILNILPDHSEVLTSPGKTNTIIVEYDFVSRPTVYRKKGIGKEEIWAYDGGGFNETVHFDVEWLSEDQFKISYDVNNCDEEFVVTIP